MLWLYKPSLEFNSNSGKAAADASRRKRQTTYPELVAARRCRLVLLSLEVGAEMADFLRRLAAAKARAAPAWLRAATRQAACHRWAGIIAVAAQRALAFSLLQLPPAMADECDGDAGAKKNYQEARHECLLVLVPDCRIQQSRVAMGSPASLILVDRKEACDSQRGPSMVPPFAEPVPPHL